MANVCLPPNLVIAWSETDGSGWPEAEWLLSDDQSREADIRSEKFEAERTQMQTFSGT